MVSAPMIGIFHYLMDTLILDTLNQMIEIGNTCASMQIVAILRIAP